jgi:predicted component of type VI protein secretion system
VQGKQAELASIQLPYGLKALEPRIDAKTMELHVSTAAAAAAAATAEARNLLEPHNKFCTLVRQNYQTHLGQALARLESREPTSVVLSGFSRCYRTVTWQLLDWPCYTMNIGAAARVW